MPHVVTYNTSEDQHSVEYGMGILDELKQKSNEKQRSQTSEQDQAQQREARYREEILPAMQKAFLFMQELVEHLNFLEHAVVVDLYSPQYPQLGQLQQQDYKIYTDDHGGFADFSQLMQIIVRFFCVGQGSFSYNLEGKSRIEREISFLSSHHVPFEWKPADSNNGLQRACFTITRKIPVRFRFSVNYANSLIQLQINNHENFGTYKKNFTSAEINDGLLDEIARFMLRRDSDFIHLEMSLMHRQHIQRLLQQEQQYQEELQRILPNKDAPKAKKTISSHLKRMLRLKNPADSDDGQN